jgi:hypothetical protein
MSWKEYHALLWKICMKHKAYDIMHEYIEKCSEEEE